MQISFDHDDLVANRPDDIDLLQLIKHESFFQLPAGLHPRVQSKKIDKIIGYRIPKIEQGLLKRFRAYDTFAPDAEDRKQHYQGTQTWIGLHPQILQTPYSDMLHFLNILKKYNPKVIVDLGAAYGRMPVVMKAILGEVEFIGYEILPERINEAVRIHKKLNLTNCSMMHQDILADNFELPKASVYFIYDFSNPMDIRRILQKLKERLHTEQFFIVACGEGVRSLIQNKFPEFWSCHGVIHQKGWSIYSSFTDL